MEKWKKIVRILKQDGCHYMMYGPLVAGRERVTVQEKCGYCDEFCKHGDVLRCNLCPLFDYACSASYQRDNIFWNVITALREKEYKEALKHAKEMLVEVKRYKDKFK